MNAERIPSANPTPDDVAEAMAYCELQGYEGDSRTDDAIIEHARVLVAEVRRLQAKLSETEQRWYASNRAISALEAKLERVEAVVPELRATPGMGPGYMDGYHNGIRLAANKLEAALKGEP